MTRRLTGADLLCRTLEELGAGFVFGLPGTQTVDLYEALRRSRLRTVLASHELAAAFMACGYYRASGRPGTLVTIPGPGFTYALTGLAEARLDSTAVVHIVLKAPSVPGRKFELQALDQRAMALPVVKRFFEVESGADLAGAIEAAYATSLSGEPGPVVVQVGESILAAEAGARVIARHRPEPPDDAAVREVASSLAGGRRIVLLLGQGANGAPAAVLALAERLGAWIVTTTSARGIVPEDHPQCRIFDGGSGAEPLNTLLDRADLVLALGCKFSHNGAHGFRLRLPADRLIRVDASREVLDANYPAAQKVGADVPAFLAALLSEDALRSRTGGDWGAAEAEGSAPGHPGDDEPRFPGASPPTAAAFFEALRRAMPRDACLVVDSGLHQVLARRHFRVFTPRGFVAPADFQSMGFALPAAIGARLASDRPVVALVGDGGLLMTGLELLTAVRESIPLTVVVFNDGHLGLIRRQQLQEHGHAHATDLGRPDFQALAATTGARYVPLAHAESDLAAALSAPGVTLVEVALADSLRLRVSQLSARARSFAGRLRRFLRPD